jgi:hypothetical protein
MAQEMMEEEHIYSLLLISKKSYIRRYFLDELLACNQHGEEPCDS